MKELPSQYDHKEHEEKIYKLWQDSGFFNPDNLAKSPKQKNFSIIMPPPNANGALHMGHALFVTLQDIMIRFKRMQGYKTLWLPGADHAGFETQVVYQKKLEKEGRSFWEIPKDKLYEEILAFTLANKKHMENQLRQLGASCDWSREKFTLDEDIKKVVYETFKKLYDDNLVYKAERPVNWCTRHQTTLSDLEIKHEERKDKLFYIRYKLENSNDYIVVATTRPETIPADIAIAVNPRSKWKNYIGKNVINPLTNEAITVISDERVEITFGTGALKITPHHDALDFEIAKDNSELPASKSVINRYGAIENSKTELDDLKVLPAREKSIELLKNSLDKEPEDYIHQVSICYKCNTLIEPRIMNQWFIKTTEKTKNGGESLKDLAIDAIKTKKVKFITKKFEKIFMHWMKNLRDWNISRQIVWGIKIPAWYHENPTAKCKDVIISENEPTCKICNGKFIQETDVFDTWFSSGQWPFASLMSTHDKNDFKNFYPTDVMETGWDIIFFWVARMIMLGTYKTGEVPFKTIYLHGLVRDKDRQKMSKSKGNVIDPLGVADIYGADAIRMSLVVGTAPGNDPIISEDKIRGYRNFSTKIWNATRLITMRGSREIPEKPNYTAEDKKTLKEFDKFKKEFIKDMESYRFHEASNKIYHYFWHTFADKIIEGTKARLQDEDVKIKETATALLMNLLSEQLKLLHPFMPFVTEAIWQELHGGKKMLMVEKL